MKKTLKIISIITLSLFLSGCAGFLECRVSDYIINDFYLESCKDGESLFFDKNYENLSVSSTYLIIKKYSFDENNIYVYSEPKKTQLRREYFNKNGEYESFFDEKISEGNGVLYTKINHKTKEILYFKNKSELLRDDEKIFSRLEEITSMEKKGEWKRKRNHHNVNFFKGLKMFYWDGTFNYPSERIEFEELFPDEKNS